MGDDLVAPLAQDNPTGYWEPKTVVRLNDAVFSGFGGAWFSLAYGAFGLWALWTSRQQFR